MISLSQTNDHAIKHQKDIIAATKQFRKENPNCVSAKFNIDIAGNCISCNYLMIGRHIELSNFKTKKSTQNVATEVSYGFPNVGYTEEQEAAFKSGLAKISEKRNYYIVNGIEYRGKKGLQLGLNLLKF